MSSLSAKDRKSLCRFTFADGRECRIPPPLAIPTSAPITPAKTPRPAPPINSPAISLISSPANYAFTTLLPTSAAPRSGW
jgi:hypothetical protein